MTFIFLKVCSAWKKPDQDTEFRDFFYRDVLADLKAGGKMVLVICHDDHYFDVADRLIKLESGKIIYDGAPVAS